MASIIIPESINSLNSLNSLNLINHINKNINSISLLNIKEEDAVQIALTGKYGKGKFTWISKQDQEQILKHSWSLHNNHDIVTSLNGKYCKLHYFIYCIQMGNILPDGCVIDHKNCQILDNTRTNLRAATYLENSANRILASNNISGCKNIHYYQTNKKWRIEVKNKHIGYVDNIDDAIAIAQNSAKIIFGEFTHLDTNEHYLKISREFDKLRMNDPDLNFKKFHKEKKNQIATPIQSVSRIIIHDKEFEYCQQQWNILGDVPGSNIARIFLSGGDIQHGEYFIIDAIDEPVINRHKWRLRSNSISTSFHGRDIYIHQFIMQERMKKTPINDQTIDHCSCFNWDNRRNNLRYASKSQQSANRNIQSNNTTGVKGVCMKANNLRSSLTLSVSFAWTTTINFEKTKITLGNMKKKQHASYLFDIASDILFGAYGRPNYLIRGDSSPLHFSNHLLSVHDLQSILHLVKQYPEAKRHKLIPALVPKIEKDLKFLKQRKNIEEEQKDYNNTDTNNINDNLSLPPSIKRRKLS